MTRYVFALFVIAGCSMPDAPQGVAANDATHQRIKVLDHGCVPGQMQYTDCGQGCCKKTLLCDANGIWWPQDLARDLEKPEVPTEVVNGADDDGDGQTDNILRWTIDQHPNGVNRTAVVDPIMQFAPGCAFVQLIEATLDVSPLGTGVGPYPRYERCDEAHPCFKAACRSGETLHAIAGRSYGVEIFHRSLDQFADRDEYVGWNSLEIGKHGVFKVE